MECGVQRSVFFDRDVGRMDRPGPEERRLEVKVMWGPVVLDVREFGPGEVVTVGARTDASVRLTGDPFRGELLELASPGGPDGVLIHLSAGMRLEVKPACREVEPVEPPGMGQVRNHALRLGQRARVMVGRLAFVFQYVQDARPVRSRVADRADLRMPKYWLMVFIVALGAWFAVETTPTTQAASTDYLTNPARFAQLITPSEPKDENHFPEILKKPEVKSQKPHDQSKWEVKNRLTRRGDAIPRRRRPDDDRKIAENSGILRLLKRRGGTGGPDGALFRGVQAISLDEDLEGIRRVGMGPAGSFADMGTRTGDPGGGGPGFDIDGISRGPWGKVDSPAYGNIPVGTRQKSNVTWDRKRTRIVGGLTRKVVGEYIQRRWLQFKHCYEKGLGRSPNMYGKVTTTFTIDSEGRVSETDVLQSTLDNADVEVCVLRAIRLIRFPKPRGGGVVIVTYPFLFRSAGD